MTALAGRTAAAHITMAASTVAASSIGRITLVTPAFTSEEPSWLAD